MNKAVLITLAILSGGAAAQTSPTPCEREADAKLGEMWSATSIAGSVTYTKLMNRAVACMQGGRCSKPEALVHMAELMVDDQVIEVQRKKVAIMKRMVEEVRRSSDICKIAPQVTEIMAEIVSLNAQQLSRMEELSVQFYPGAK